MIKKPILIIGIFILITTPLFSQIPDFSKVVHRVPGDSVNITYLINHGIRVKKGKAIAWFPKDSLTAKQMKGIS
jgi:hypothetical protein